MESCGGQDRLCMILYLTGNECFLVTMPIGDLTKSEKGGWVNGPALHPAATSLARYSMMTSGWSKADFAIVWDHAHPLTLKANVYTAMFNALEQCLLHHAWSGWFARYLWKLLRCSGDCTTKTTLGSRVLLLTVVTDMYSFAMGECASVQLKVITALSPTVEPFIWLHRWGGLGWTLIWLSASLAVHHFL